MLDRGMARSGSIYVPRTSAKQRRIIVFGMHLSASIPWGGGAAASSVQASWHKPVPKTICCLCDNCPYDETEEDIDCGQMTHWRTLTHDSVSDSGRVWELILQ